MTPIAEDISPPQAGELQTVLAALGRIEEQLASLTRKQPKEHYSTEEIAKMLGKADFTVREWCRLGRINASKRFSGRGKHQSWVVSHAELLRIEREGLLPLESFNTGYGRK